MNNVMKGNKEKKYYINLFYKYNVLKKRHCKYVKRKN